jgi:enoyl-CoA hydratase/carnithine racemase
MALIDYRAEDGLGIIEINNPPANVYTLESLKLLDEAIIQARFDSSVHVLVLMGAGDKFFSAGADIRMLSDSSSVRSSLGSTEVWQTGWLWKGRHSRWHLTVRMRRKGSVPIRKRELQYL